MDLERFFHVAIKTDDLEASVAFYRDTLGGEVIESGPAGGGSEYAALEVADKRIYCFEHPPYETNGLAEDLPTGILHFGFVVPDVDAAVEAMDAAGTEVFMPPDTFGDLRIAFVYGPDGELIELIEEL
jgi:catechol 2,3-dioxygenase-like lactoylglutathione lyase family enzyme